MIHGSLREDVIRQCLSTKKLNKKKKKSEGEKCWRHLWKYCEMSLEVVSLLITEMLLTEPDQHCFFFSFLMLCCRPWNTDSLSLFIFQLCSPNSNKLVICYRVYAYNRQKAYRHHILTFFTCLFSFLLYLLQPFLTCKPHPPQCSVNRRGKDWLHISLFLEPQYKEIDIFNISLHLTISCHSYMHDSLPKRPPGLRVFSYCLDGRWSSLPGACLLLKTCITLFIVWLCGKHFWLRLKMVLVAPAVRSGQQNCCVLHPV